MSEEKRAGPRIEVWREPNGEWRWRYLGIEEVDGEPVELPANEAEPTQEEAVSAAKLAYPNVPVEVLTRREHVPVAVSDPQRPVWTAMAAGLAAALMAVALRQRRWGIALIAPVVATGVVMRQRRRLP